MLWRRKNKGTEKCFCNGSADRCLSFYCDTDPGISLYKTGAITDEGSRGGFGTVGDSKTPIYFLALSCVVNVVLDFLMVGVEKQGVFGAGIATLAAEALSSILCVVYIYRKIPVLSLKREEWKMEKEAAKIILTNGGVTAFQQFMQPIGKVLIQGCIDQYGISVIAAFNAVNRIDDFACIPEQSISHAMMNYISQSDGAGKEEKKREGFRKGMVLEVGYGIQGYFRGIQRMKITLISTCIQITLRVISVYLLTPRCGMNGAAYACAIGWSVMILYQLNMLHKYKR